MNVIATSIYRTNFALKMFPLQSCPADVHSQFLSQEDRAVMTLRSVTFCPLPGMVLSLLWTVRPHDVCFQAGWKLQLYPCLVQQGWGWGRRPGAGTIPVLHSHCPPSSGPVTLGGNAWPQPHAWSPSILSTAGICYHFLINWKELKVCCPLLYEVSPSILANGVLSYCSVFKLGIAVHNNNIFPTSDQPSPGWSPWDILISGNFFPNETFSYYSCLLSKLSLSLEFNDFCVWCQERF